MVFAMAVDPLTQLPRPTCLRNFVAIGVDVVDFHTHLRTLTQLLRDHGAGAPGRQLPCWISDTSMAYWAIADIRSIARK